MKECSAFVHFCVNFIPSRCLICRDLHAFLGVKFGLEDLLRVKYLTFCNSGYFSSPFPSFPGFWLILGVFFWVLSVLKTRKNTFFRVLRFPLFPTMHRPYLMYYLTYIWFVTFVNYKQNHCLSKTNFGGFQSKLCGFHQDFVRFFKEFSEEQSRGFSDVLH